MNRPVLAAVLSVFLPGVGHFYSGAWSRGYLVLFVSYVAVALAGVLGPYAGWLAIIAVDAGAAYDAWKTAHASAAREAAEAASPPAERGWIHWLWALVRAGWISVFFALFGLSALFISFDALKTGSFTGAAIGFVAMIFITSLCWLAAAETYRVMNGTRPLSLSSARNELGATIFFGGILVLMLMIVYPYFADLPRKSTEGAMKGHLATLRESFARYRAEKAENPPSLDAVAAGTESRRIPELWTTVRQPHKKTREAIALPDGQPTDSGKWAYAVGTSTPIFIDCTHTDSKGRAWNAY